MASVIDGGFSLNGLPFVHARVSLPGLMPPTETVLSVPFLVDTGASSTSLSPRDAQDLGLDLSRLNYSARSMGIGGSSFSALADGIITLRGDGFDFVCPVSIRIAQPTVHNMRLPSLLGRDVLRQFNMRYEAANGILQFISNESTMVVHA